MMPGTKLPYQYSLFVDYEPAARWCRGAALLRCRGAWARVTIDRFRHLSLSTFDTAAPGSTPGPRLTAAWCGASSVLATWNPEIDTDFDGAPAPVRPPCPRPRVSQSL